MGASLFAESDGSFIVCFAQHLEKYMEFLAAICTTV